MLYLQICHLKSKKISISWIINGFAVLHCLTTLFCHALRISDTMMLTLLTMVMTLLICLRERQSIELSAVFIILVNIIGYAVGVGLQAIFKNALGFSSMLNPALSTLITTELLGWTLYAFIRRFGRVPKEADSPEYFDTSLKWMIAAVVIIFILRFFVTAAFSNGLFTEHDVKDVVSDFFDNSIVLILLIVLSIFSQYLNRRFFKKWNMLLRWVVIGLIIVITSALAALIVELDLPMHFNLPLEAGYFEELTVIALIVNVSINLIVFVTGYVINARRSMESERSKANLAQFQYIKLKQQINPHFLFNSLNVLDALVSDGRNKDASTYIQKLSGMYRYMLNNDNRPLVKLRDELEYTRMYIDLMKIRFEDGMNVEISVPDADLEKYVVPSSVQLLVENAAKHNAVSASRQLRVRITSDGETITVRNNLNPKFTRVQSTGLGQKYIRQQYLDASGQDIKIEKTDDEYIVALPLIEQLRLSVVENDTRN
jgi:two-component system LytT family sensor kinase